MMIDPSRFDAEIFDLDAVITDIAGIHAKAWAQRRYAGLEFRDDAIHFDPRSPEEITELRFQFRNCNQRIDATVTHYRLELTTHPGIGPAASVTVGAVGQMIEIEPHGSVSIDLRPRAGSPS